MMQTEALGVNDREEGVREIPKMSHSRVRWGIHGPMGYEIPTEGSEGVLRGDLTASWAVKPELKATP